MAIAYNTTGSPGTGTLAITGDGALDLPTIVANQDASAMTDNGNGTFTCDRAIDIRGTTAGGIVFTTNFVQLTVQATGLTGSLNTLFQFKEGGAPTLWNAESFQLMCDADNTSFSNLFGQDADANHAQFDWKNVSVIFNSSGGGDGFVRIYRGNADAQWLDCSFYNCSGRLGGGSTTFVGGKSFDNIGFAQLTAIANYEDALVDGGLYVVNLNSAISLPATYKSLVGRNIQTATVNANPNTPGNVIYRILDIVSNLGRTTSVTPKAAGQIVTIEWAYTLTSKVVDDGNAAEQDVRRCVFDDASVNLDNTLSDASGLWSDLEVVHSEDECESGSAVNTQNGPFQVRYFKYGFLERRDTGLALDAPRPDDFKLTIDSGIQETNKATAAAYTGISYTPATGAITLSGTQPSQNVHDYIMSQFGESGTYNVETTFRPIILAGANYELLGAAVMTISGTYALSGFGLSGDITVTAAGTASGALDGTLTLSGTLSGTGTATGAITLASTSNIQGTMTPSGATSVPAAASVTGTTNIPTGATVTFATDTQAAAGTVNLAGGTLALTVHNNSPLSGNWSGGGDVNLPSVMANTLHDLRNIVGLDGTTTINYAGSQDVVVKITGAQTPPTLNYTGAGGSLVIDSNVDISIDTLAANTRYRLSYNDAPFEQIAEADAPGGVFSVSVPGSTRPVKLQHVFIDNADASTALAYGEALGQLNATTGTTVLVEQVADQVYRDNAINGGSTTEFTAVGASIRVDVMASPNETTFQRLYNWFQWNMTQANQLDFFNGDIRAISQAQYVVQTALTVRNIHPTDTLLMSGGEMTTDPSVDPNPIAWADPTPPSIISINSIAVPVSQTEILNEVSRDNGVWIDEVAGTPGTDSDSGTPGNPVDNWADAKVIAASKNLSKYIVKGNSTVDEDIEDSIIVSSTEQGTLTISSVSLDGTSIQDFQLLGTMTGRARFTRCVMAGISGVDGAMRECAINAAGLTLASTSASVSMLNCASSVGGTNKALINCNGAALSNLSVRNFSGGILITNLTNPTSNVSLNMDPGSVEFDASCTTTSTNVKVEGIGSGVVNNGTMPNPDVSGYNPADATGAWEFLIDGEKAGDILAWVFAAAAGENDGALGAPQFESPSGTVIVSGTTAPGGKRTGFTYTPVMP